MASSLRLILGHGIKVDHARQLNDMRKVLIGKTPDLLFLDDRLGAGVIVENTLAKIRAIGYRRGVVVISGFLTRARLIELLRLGVADVVHKDDIDSARLAEAMLKVLEAPAALAQSAPASDFDWRRLCAARAARRRSRQRDLFETVAALGGGPQASATAWMFASLHTVAVGGVSTVRRKNGL